MKCLESSCRRWWTSSGAGDRVNPSQVLIIIIIIIINMLMLAPIIVLRI
jgi:hypothetical protein